MFAEATKLCVRLKVLCLDNKTHIDIGSSESRVDVGLEPLPDTVLCRTKEIGVPWRRERLALQLHDPSESLLAHALRESRGCERRCVGAVLVEDASHGSLNLVEECGREEVDLQQRKESGLHVYPEAEVAHR